MKGLFAEARHTVRLSAALVGTVVGAGFVSGAELVRFFPAQGILPHAAIAAGLFFGCFLLLYRCGARYGGFEGVLRQVFGRVAALFRLLILTCSLIMCGSMLAGLDVGVREGFGIAYSVPVAALLTLPLLYGLSHRGVKGIYTVNLLLVPLILAFVSLYAAGVGQAYVPGKPAEAFGSLLAVLLYVAMNCFLAAPVVCDAGAARKPGGAGCALAAMLIGFCIAAVLGSVVRADAANAPFPFLAVAGRSGALGKLFALVCICGIVTTLFSSYYPLHCSVEGKKGAPFWRAGLCVCAFALSAIGLQGIVRWIYPLVGAAGLVFFVIVAVRERRLLFDEQPLSQSDQRVHARSQYTQNGGRRHYKV